MLIRITTEQLLQFVQSHYQPGDPLPAKRADAEFRYQRIGKYAGPCEHLFAPSVTTPRDPGGWHADLRRESSIMIATEANSASC
jgi:hypothetical protein